MILQSPILLSPKSLVYLDYDLQISHDFKKIIPHMNPPTLNYHPFYGPLRNHGGGCFIRTGKGMNQLILDDGEIFWDTRWLFNIAMENGPWIDDFPIKTSIYKGFFIAMLNNKMVIFRYDYDRLVQWLWSMIIQKLWHYHYHWTTWMYCLSIWDVSYMIIIKALIPDTIMH